MSIASLSSFILFMTIEIAAAQKPIPESAWPPVTPAQALARSTRDAATWSERTAPGRPRLFFTAAQWRDLPRRFAQASGRERELFDRVLARARQIASQPVPAYRTPEELTSATLTLYAAEEELWQRQIGDNMVALSLALALQDQPRIRTKLRESVLTSCGYPCWGRKPRNSDLSFGHLARGIAIAYDWHPDLWSSEEKELIRSAVRERAEDAKQGLYGAVYWAKRYRENHNHVPIAGLGLCGVAFLGEIPEAAEWTAAALANFENVAHFGCADGSSPEGVPYGSYSLSFILQFIEGTRQILETGVLYQTPFLRNASSDRLHASTPGFNGVLPWGDAVNRDYCGPQHLLYRLAAEYRDEDGQYLAGQIQFPPQGESDVIAWTALWYDSTLPERPPASLDHHANVSDLVMTRTGWAQEEYLLCIKSGVNRRNHGHLDAGALAWISGNDWLLTTPGYGKGGGNPDFWKSHGPRWTFFSNASESHSTLLIDGANQRFAEGAGGAVDDFASGGDWCWTGIDLSGAYENARRVRREVLHRRGDYALVFDEVLTPHRATVEWLAQVPVSAETDLARVTARGETGELEVRALLPAEAKFSPRQPGSRHIDIPSTRLKTLALKAEGDAVRFAVAMLPASAGAKSKVRDIRNSEEQSGSVFVVDGEGWQDRILIAAGDELQAIETEAAPDASLKTRARVTAVRFVGGEVESVLLVGARHIACGSLALDTADPAQMVLRRIEEGIWTLETGSEIRLAEPGSKWRIVARTENRSLPFHAPFPKGQYMLAQGEKDPGAVLWARKRSSPAAVAALPVKALPNLPPAPATQRIVIEAAKFYASKGDQIDIVAKPGALNKLTVRGFGGGMPQQVLGWKFRVEQAGEYFLRLRYCSAWPCQFALLVDGSAPSEAALKIETPATGGWSVHESNWHETVLSDASSQPIRLSLSAGEHSISLTRATSPINLDQFELQGAQ